MNPTPAELKDWKAPPLGAAWPVAPFSSVKLADPIARPGNSLAYDLRETGSGPATRDRIVVVDLRTGSVSEGATVAGGSFLLFDRDQLYVVSPTRLSQDGSGVLPDVLRSVSSNGRSLGASVPAGSCASQATLQTTGPHGGDVWTCERRAVVLISPSSGEVAERLSTPEAGSTGLVVSADGRYLVLETGGVRSRPARLLVFDTADGAPVGRRLRVGDGTVGLVPVGHDVWLSFSGQSVHAVARYSLPRLRDRSPVQHDFPGASGSALPLPGGSVYTFDDLTSLGRVLLLVDSAGAACIQHDSSRVLAWAPFPGTTASDTGRGWSPFARTGRTVFATSPGGIVKVTLPSSCLPSRLRGSRAWCRSACR
jgi:hypothetical protein